MLKCVICGEDLKKVTKELALDERYSLLGCENCAGVSILDKLDLKIIEANSDNVINIISKGKAGEEEKKIMGTFLNKLLGKFEEERKEIHQMKKDNDVCKMIEFLNEKKNKTSEMDELVKMMDETIEEIKIEIEEIIDNKKSKAKANEKPYDDEDISIKTIENVIRSKYMIIFRHEEGDGVAFSNGELSEIIEDIEKDSKSEVTKVFKIEEVKPKKRFI